ncbi:hypothetical protein LTR08_007554 [Meristemomyces frigidus]|nr:hypothetical protein LTR08_007554 [Meristemomyces frigidus]
MAAPNDFYASSPVVGLAPTQPNPYFANSHYVSVSSVANGQTPGATSMTFTSSGSIPPTPGSLAGRKRSRGDITVLDDEEEQIVDSSVTTPAEFEEKLRGKPVYGLLGSVVYPDDVGYQVAVESQTRSWVEAQANRTPFELSHPKRPSVSCRKSQRRTNEASGTDDLAQLVLPPQMREATAEPLIDEATRVLGISWTRMDATEALRINHAAYSKWIANHYLSLTEVAVWFVNSAIPGYLVQARNVYIGQIGYYIFNDDLTEARLVTTEPEQLLPRLKMLPALHLAAPGGHLRAETDPITAAQHALSDVQANLSNGVTHFPQELSQPTSQVQDPRALPGTESDQLQEPSGMCSAHSMDLD